MERLRIMLLYLLTTHVLAIGAVTTFIAGCLMPLKSLVFSDMVSEIPVWMNIVIDFATPGLASGCALLIPKFFTGYRKRIFERSFGLPRGAFDSFPREQLHQMVSDRLRIPSPYYSDRWRKHVAKITGIL